ncbi:MAG TPA: DUF3267 domain-containing protein [Candidatus Methanoperedens sp.]
MIGQETRFADYRKIDSIGQFSSGSRIQFLCIEIITFLGFGFFFLALFALAAGRDDFGSGMMDTIYVLMIFGLTRTFHKIMHGFCAFLHTARKTIFSRNKRIAVCIAPVILTSIIGLGLMAAFPSYAHWILIFLAANLSGTAGDVWMARNLLLYPEHILLEYDEDGTSIYGTEKDRPINISSIGFVPNFMKGFAIALFILIVIVFNLLSAALPLLGVAPFTLGLKDSPYTILDYSGSDSPELFSVHSIVAPFLSFSGIIGLVYAVFKPGIQKKI